MGRAVPGKGRVLISNPQVTSSGDGNLCRSESLRVGMTTVLEDSVRLPSESLGEETQLLIGPAWRWLSSIPQGSVPTRPLVPVAQSPRTVSRTRVTKKEGAELCAIY